MRLKTDLLDVFMAVEAGKLDQVQLKWKQCVSISVVAASGGYPGKYPVGLPIEIPPDSEDTIVFHAGTELKSNLPHTYGGRVLAVTGIGIDTENARQKAYDTMSKVKFNGIHFRTDIGL